MRADRRHTDSCWFERACGLEVQMQAKTPGLVACPILLLVIRIYSSKRQSCVRALQTRPSQTHVIRLCQALLRWASTPGAPTIMGLFLRSPHASSCRRQLHTSGTPVFRNAPHHHHHHRLSLRPCRSQPSQSTSVQDVQAEANPLEVLRRTTDPQQRAALLQQLDR